MDRHPQGQLVALSAVGAATALGGAVQASAAARAGLSRPDEIPGCLAIDGETNEPQPVVGIPVPDLTAGFEGGARLARLGEAALLDLLPSAPPIDPTRTGLLLALPRPEEEVPASPEEADEEPEPVEPPDRQARWLAERLLEGAELPIPPAAWQCLLEGRRGAVEGLRRAIEALARRQLDAVLLLAVDSLADPPRAERLLEEGRLKTPEHPTGFLPGEAAVALLLERPDAPRLRHQAPLAMVGSPVAAMEAEAPEGAPAAGRVLHQVLLGALPGLTPQESGSVFLDLNGESHRAHEWGNVLVHARRASGLDRWALELPGLAFGETGTASPLLSVLLAARGFARGHLRGQRAVVGVVEDGGFRAGLQVRSAAPPRA